MGSNNGWKQSLLKSSLPLEYEISKILSDFDFDIWGDYKYTRIDEQGNEKQFSVDWWGVNSFKTSAVNSDTIVRSALVPLIECKYSHPENKWVFIPHPERSAIWRDDLILINDFFAEGVIENKKSIRSFVREGNIGLKGVELQTNGFSTHSIDRGINQLRYALPSVFTHFLKLSEYSSDGIDIDFICPILVTTADLYLINNDISIDQIHKSGELNDVAKKVSSIILNEPSNPEFEAYSGTIFKKFTTANSERYKEITELDKFKTEHKYDFRRKNELEYVFRNMATTFLIINFDSFIDEFESLLNSTESLTNHVKDFSKKQKYN